MEVKLALTATEYKGVMHVDVDKSVGNIVAALSEHPVVEVVACQMEISRIGMIIKRVEEQSKSRLVSMKTQNTIKRVNERDTRILSFRVRFERSV